MKPLFALLLLCCLLQACKKEVTGFNNQDPYLEQVKTALRDSMGSALVEQLDFSRVIRSDADSVDLHILNIPLRGVIAGSFMLVQTDKQGNIRQGRIITLKKEHPMPTSTQYNGSVTVRSLKQEVLLQSYVSDGRILALHQRHTGSNMRDQVTQAQLVPADEEMLPEVIVVGYRDASGGISYSDWVSLQSMFGGSDAGIPANAYGPASGSEGASGSYSGSGSGNGSSSNGSTTEDPPIAIDFENQYNNPAIDINAYLKCFSSIPDEGAVCSIEILADIPVDKDPNKLFDYSIGSPGHTFLQIKKTNGASSIMQNIGFYPVSGWKTALTTAPVAGKFVDNSGHEYNASLVMNITPAQLKSTLTYILYLAGFIKYDIDDYNCTDFALQVFNFACNPADRLDIPRYDIPGGMAPDGTSTPQGVYNKLKSMKVSGNAEAPNITIPGYKGWVADSHGPC